MLVTALLAWASSTHAFFPFQADDTGTQGTAGNQIEFDYIYNESKVVEFAQDGRQSISSTNSNAFPLTYTLGISNNIDLFIGSALQSSPVTGWQNAAVGAKWVFAGNQRDRWSFALKPVFLLPVSNSAQNAGLGSADVNGSIDLIGSYLAHDYQFHVNLGYATNHLKDTPDTSPQRSSIWSASVSPVWVTNQQWLVGVDFGVQTNTNFNSESSGYAQIGLSYAPIPNLQLGLGLISSSDLGDRNNTRSTSVTAGIT